MKLYTVVPDSFSEPNSCAVFSTYEKAYDYMERNASAHQTHILASKVIGHYEYPQEVYIVKKHPSAFLDEPLAELQIFSVPPPNVSFAEMAHTSIEQHIPDSQEAMVIRNNYIIARADLTAAIGCTLGEIEKLKRDIDKCDDLRKQVLLKREKKELHHKLLGQIERLERF